MVPNARSDPLCSTTVHATRPRFDSSWQRQQRYRQETENLGYWGYVHADIATSSSGRFCRSLLPMCGRRSHVHPVKTCSLQLLRAVQPTSLRSHWTYVANTHLAFLFSVLPFMANKDEYNIAKVSIYNTMVYILVKKASALSMSPFLVLKTIAETVAASTVMHWIHDAFVVATRCGDRMQQQVSTTIASYMQSVRDRYSRPIVISIIVYQMYLIDYLTSTVVFYRTRVYQRQPRNGQNWHSSVGKYVHHNRETAKIGIRTPIKLYNYFRFVS